MFNAAAISISLYVAINAQTANYTAIIPFAVASIIIFGKCQIMISIVMSRWFVCFHWFWWHFSFFQQSMCTLTLQYSHCIKRFDEAHQIMSIPVWLMDATLPVIQFIRAVRKNWNQALNNVRIFYSYFVINFVDKNKHTLVCSLKSMEQLNY